MSHYIYSLEVKMLLLFFSSFFLFIIARIALPHHSCLKFCMILFEYQFPYENFMDLDLMTIPNYIDIPQEAFKWSMTLAEYSYCSRAKKLRSILIIHFLKTKITWSPNWKNEKNKTKKGKNKNRVSFSKDFENF